MTAVASGLPRNPQTVVDLYAGPGGWDEGMLSLGVTDVTGIELDPSAAATAEAAGHRRIVADVATVPIGDHAGVRGVVASPPCQPWSSAGKRLGDADRDRVHDLVDAYAAGSDDPGAGWADDRSHHAAQPVRWIRELRPEWVCLEQVPGVLGLWRHIGRVLTGWGYSVWCGRLVAADYGVPQTRTRAILIASRVRPVGPPPPSHYDPRKGRTLFGEPWVSMAAALGWDGTIRTGQDSTISRAGDRVRYERETSRPAPTVMANTGRWKHAGDAREGATVRDLDEPAGALFCSRPGNLQWVLQSRRDSPTWVAEHGERENRAIDEPAVTITGEAHRWTWVLRNNTQDNAAERGLDEPAPTLFFGERLNAVNWVATRPATTVQGDPRIAPPGHRDREGGERQFGPETVKVSTSEAAVLQGFRADYPWTGNRTQQYQQIGNAVPPPLAAAIVRTVAS